MLVITALLDESSVLLMGLASVGPQVIVLVVTQHSFLLIDHGVSYQHVSGNIRTLGLSEGVNRGILVYIICCTCIISRWY